jgi:hypothetical protein
MIIGSIKRNDLLKPHASYGVFFYTQNGWDMDFCKITKNLDL